VVKPGGAVVLLDHVRPGGALGPVFDLLSLITTSLFADHFNRRTAEAAQAAGLEVTLREKRLLGIVNLIVCRNSLPNQAVGKTEGRGAGFELISPMY